MPASCVRGPHPASPPPPGWCALELPAVPPRGVPQGALAEARARSLTEVAQADKVKTQLNAAIASLGKNIRGPPPSSGPAC